VAHELLEAVLELIISSFAGPLLPALLNILLQRSLANVMTVCVYWCNCRSDISSTRLFTEIHNILPAYHSTSANFSLQWM